MPFESTVQLVIVMYQLLAGNSGGTLSLATGSSEAIPSRRLVLTRFIVRLKWQSTDCPAVEISTPLGRSAVEVGGSSPPDISGALYVRCCLFRVACAKQISQIGPGTR